MFLCREIDNKPVFIIHQSGFSGNKHFTNSDLSSTTCIPISDVIIWKTLFKLQGYSFSHYTYGVYCIYQCFDRGK